MTTLHERIAELQLRRHLADVAIGSHSQHDERVDFGGAAVGDREIGRRPARVEDANPASFRERTQFRIVADKRVQAAPDLQLLLDRGAEPRLPFVRQASAEGSDADQNSGCALTLRDAALEVADDGNLAAESKHVLRRLPRLLAVEHRHDALGKVPDARVRGFRGERAEFAIRDDQETVLRSSHWAEPTARRRSTPVHASVGRSTAVLYSPVSP